MTVNMSYPLWWPNRITEIFQAKYSTHKIFDVKADAENALIRLGQLCQKYLTLVKSADTIGPTRCLQVGPSECASLARYFKFENYSGEVDPLVGKPKRG